MAQDSEFEDGFITTTEDAEDMQGNGETVALDASQEYEEKWPGSSMPVCVAVPRIQREFLIPYRGISTRSSSTLSRTLTVPLLLLLRCRQHLHLDLPRLLRTRRQCE